MVGLSSTDEPLEYKLSFFLRFEESCGRKIRRRGAENTRQVRERLAGTRREVGRHSRTVDPACVEGYSSPSWTLGPPTRGGSGSYSWGSGHPVRCLVADDGYGQDP